MGRRRSTSTVTRLVQVLFAILWIGFLFYMVRSYMEPKPGVVADAENPETPIVETPQNTDGTFGLTPPVVTASTSNTASTNNAVPKIEAGPSARKILDGTLAAYRNAPAYSDRGKLQISWKAADRPPFVEEYPWSFAWNRDGRLQSNIFDAKVRSNGRLLSCFVSEIRTENLKNQQLFLKGQQLIGQLYQDKIAAYYLNGGERIPVNETIVPNSTLLAPPTLSLLTNETTSPWFNVSSKPKRLPDQKLTAAPFGGQECYVIECPSPQGNLVAWIDKQNSMIRQIKLPNRLLDPLLAADANVRDLQFYAKFPGASFDSSKVTFEPVAPQAGVWPVREYVAPADPLPTNLVGELAPQFKLQTEKRVAITSQQFLGKPTAMLMIDGGDSDAELIQKFDAISKNIAAKEYQFFVVAGPGSLEQMPGGSWRPVPSIQPMVNRTEVPFLADLDGGAVRGLELASQPAVILLGANSNIQYADLVAKPAGYNGKISVSQRWNEDLVAAIAAQKRGVNIADDMRGKYRSYLDKYFNDRDQRSVASWFPGFAVPNQQKVAAVPVNVRREQSTKRSALKQQPKLIWESTKLTSPGNVATVSDARGAAKGLLILDGWQTVSLFSVDGKPISRKRLKLPEDVAVASMRPLVSSQGDQHFAMFSVGGKQVFLFDAAMEFVAAFPESASARFPILACETLPGKGAKNDQLLICFGGEGGGVRFDSFSGSTSSIGKTAVRALALSGSKVLAADERTGALLAMSENGKTIDGKNEYNHITSGAAGASVFAATGINANGEWSMALLDDSLQIKKSFPISSAIFENGLEPISGILTGATGVWAVADNSNRIYLLSDAGVWLGDLAADGKVSGLKLLQVDGRTRLVVSTDRKIECWELNFAPDRVGAIQGPQ